MRTAAALIAGIILGASAGLIAIGIVTLIALT